MNDSHQPNSFSPCLFRDLCFYFLVVIHVHLPLFSPPLLSKFPKLFLPSLPLFLALLLPHYSSVDWKVEISDHPTSTTVSASPHITAGRISEAAAKSGSSGQRKSRKSTGRKSGQALRVSDPLQFNKILRRHVDVQLGNRRSVRLLRSRCGFRAWGFGGVVSRDCVGRGECSAGNVWGFSMVCWCE